MLFGYLVCYTYGIIIIVSHTPIEPISNQRSPIFYDDGNKIIVFELYRTNYKTFRLYCP